MDTDFQHKDEWRRFGKNFLVTVTRHFDDPSPTRPYEGPHRWAVYAYIYPSHPHFAKFVGDDFWQPAAQVLPMHYCVSFLRRHYNAEGATTSIQVGADYHHLHDGHFTGYATREDAGEVFHDATVLFEKLTELADVEPPV